MARHGRSSRTPSPTDRASRNLHLNQCLPRRSSTSGRPARRRRQALRTPWDSRHRAHHRPARPARPVHRRARECRDRRPARPPSRGHRSFRHPAQGRSRPRPLPRRGRHKPGAAGAALVMRVSRLRCARLPPPRRADTEARPERDRRDGLRAAIASSSSSRSSCGSGAGSARLRRRRRCRLETCKAADDCRIDERPAILGRWRHRRGNDVCGLFLVSLERRPARIVRNRRNARRRLRRERRRPRARHARHRALHSALPRG